MDKQVIGMAGVSAPMGNYNADFSGNPRTTYSGKIFSTGFAFKRQTKDNFEAMFPGKIFGLRSYKAIQTDEGVSYSPRTLEERYEYKFGKSIESPKKKKKNSKKNTEKDSLGEAITEEEAPILNEKEILSNLLSCYDCRNFGLTTAVPGVNRSITGVAQISDALDLTPDNRSERETITSSFSSDSSKKNTTVGSYAMTEEAHYFFPFDIFPNAIKSFVDDGITTEYSDEDYNNLKSAMLSCATQGHSRTKSPCFNEFAIFIEMDSKASRPDLRSSIHFEKVENGRNKISFNAKSWVPELKEQILKIEVYIEPDTVEFCTDISEFIDDLKVYDIRTNKDITKDITISK